MNTRVALLSGKIATFVGVGFVVFGVLLTFLALTVDVPWGQLTGKALLEQSLTGVLLTLMGLLSGVPFVILGQIMLILVRQTDLLTEIAQALERRE
jgi:hypothetical protein